MSDYDFDMNVLRGQMASQLGGNEEQFAFVVSEAICCIDIDSVIELGQLGDTAENYPDDVAEKLIRLGTAIKNGEVR